MKWFSGSIGDAIQKSKREKRIFIVYITGQDELSKKMDATLENTEVTALCGDQHCVALKLKANGEECGFFSQIYPVVTVPSVYFIAVNGSPIEVTAGYVEPNAFCQIIQSVIKNHRAQTDVSPPLDTQSIKMSNVQTAVSSGQPASGQADSASSNHTVTTDSNSAAPALEERIDIAKQKIEEKRLQKQEIEEEGRRQKEIERRKLGQDMAKLKQFQEEKKRKELQEQLAKERTEKTKERERIKQELEKDRAERAAKYRKDRETQEKQKEEMKQTKELAQNKINSEAEAKKREQARLQIRLPDGSSLTNVFPSGDRLQTVHDFVSQRVGTSVTLSTTFPRRTFTAEDMSKTLLILELVPSAVLIAVPGKVKGGTINPSGGGGILSLVISPLITLWNFLYMFIFGRSSPPQEQKKEESSEKEQMPSESPSSPASRGAQPQSAYQRRPLRTDGNVRRLTDMIDDDDDENATWNGNSTQQM